MIASCNYLKMQTIITQIPSHHEPCGSIYDHKGEPSGLLAAKESEESIGMHKCAPIPSPGWDAGPLQVKLQGSNFTKALKAIAVVHSFCAIESEGNLN
jgi:hypothetical protein